MQASNSLGYLSPSFEKRLSNLLEGAVTKWCKDIGLDSDISFSTKQKVTAMFDRLAVTDDQIAATLNNGYFKLIPVTKVDGFWLCGELLGLENTDTNSKDYLAMVEMESAFLKRLTDALLLGVEIDADVSKTGFNYICEFEFVIQQRVFSLKVSSVFVQAIRTKLVDESAFERVVLLDSDVQEKQVSFQVKMQTEKLTFKQFNSLKVGDVIELRQKTNKPIPIKLGNSKQSVAGYLISNKNHKAIILD